MRSNICELHDNFLSLRLFSLSLLSYSHCGMNVSALFGHIMCLRNINVTRHVRNNCEDSRRTKNETKNEVAKTVDKSSCYEYGKLEHETK